jgi:molybdate/tungstate transport system substrate-binding protein
VLKVFHAGSLSLPFQRLERIFEQSNPGLDVQREAYGSATVIRQVTELGRPADLVASADYRLIDRLMIEGNPPSADWNVLFARNAIIVAYGRADDPMDADNWAETLMRDEVRVGMSNPNQDPCGYRGLFCTYLAGGNLFRELVLANSNLTVAQGNGNAVIGVPGDVRYTGRLVMRPKETDLIALLESGVIDFLFIYRSVAEQHGLHFMEFPVEVDLSSPALGEHYGKVSVEQFADRPERKALVQASPIVYGLTIPRGAPHPERALRFAELALSERGRRVFEENGQPPIAPPLLSPASTATALPRPLAGAGVVPMEPPAERR